MSVVLVERLRSFKRNKGERREFSNSLVENLGEFGAGAEED